MGIAVFGALGRFRNITTLSQTMTFMRVIANADVVIYANVQRLAKNIVFGQVALTASGADAIAAHAIAMWTLLPG